MIEDTGLNQMKFYQDFQENEANRKMNNYHLEKYVNHEQMARNLIAKVIKNGPAGLLEASILSLILKRRIRVWNENVPIVLIDGKGEDKPEIQINFKKKRRSPCYLGHWSLRGGQNPLLSKHGRNDCLFEAIASQTGLQSAELRRRIALELYRNRDSILKFILAENIDANAMLGGARYSGSSARDAANVLDASQRGFSHPDGSSGHPRGHASHPEAKSPTDSIENYSSSRWRSGFLSRADQNLVCHYSLRTRSARDLMERLNNGIVKEAAQISRNELDCDYTPPAQIWRSHRAEGSPSDFHTLVLVGKHFMGSYNDPDADIFILTFYPVL